MKSLVIFDCDGVLVDSEAIASTVLAERLTQAGHPYTPEECFVHFTGLSLDSCRAMVEAKSGRQLPEDFFRCLQHETFVRFSEELQPVSGIVDVLEFLRDQQWPCCVASSGSHEKMAMTLEKTGLRKYFDDRIFSASDVLHGKPAPDLFLHAALSQDYQPARCIVIEDSIPGVLAGIAAGMKVCAFGARLAIPADAQMFNCMSELPAMLESMNDRILYEQER